ncbi:MAG TPA: hypothetical protein VGD21_12090 [Lysobacter sp.]
MTALHSAELAWYVTGRFYGAADGSLADYGYFLHLAGIESELFNGPPGEATAHFTFAAVPFQASGISNGALSLALDPVGDFSLYLQRTPAGTFDDPASFARGECIAIFRRTSMVAGTTVNAPTPTTSTPMSLVASNVFSARLVHGVPFEFAGKQHDLAKTIGYGVTQFGTAATTPIDPPPQGYDVVMPFSGSAIALAAR